MRSPCCSTPTLPCRCPAVCNPPRWKSLIGPPQPTSTTCASGGPVEVKVILDRPRQGVDVDIEFYANWAAGESLDDNLLWRVQSVTDVELQVTYLPSKDHLGDRTYFYREHYIVPDRADNPRFYDAQMQNIRQPGQVRGYSFVVHDQRVSQRDLPAHLKNHGSLSSSNWKLVPGSIREIALEQHHYLTWQRRQIHNYYLWKNTWPTKRPAWAWH